MQEAQSNEVHVEDGRLTSRSTRMTRRAFGAMAVAASALPMLANRAGADETPHQSLIDWGILDVTDAPFNADLTGATDSTAAIQSAVSYARENRLVAYFPIGTYTISDTIECALVGSDPRMYPHILMGERRAPSSGVLSGQSRPVIRLADESPGFGDPANQKKVINIWRENAKGGEQPNTSVLQTFIGIDIEIGAGNAGAVGIYCRGAQGTGVQDCSIDARNGDTGLSGGAGAGGGHANVTVIGGRIGIDIDTGQPGGILTGVTLIGQSEAAIQYRGMRKVDGPCSIVGLKIVNNGRGPAIVAGVSPNASEAAPSEGVLSIADATIEFTEKFAEQTVIESTRCFYLSNLYIKGAKWLFSDTNDSQCAVDRENWTHIKEYAHVGPTVNYKGFSYKSPVYVDGRRLDSDHAVMETAVAIPPDDIVLRHLWDDRFPSWEFQGFVNVKDYGAVGDGETDDTEAVQRVIDENDLVFLPKGRYRVTRTINLRSSTKVVGVGPWLSVFMVADASGDFADPYSARPVVQSADDAEADTVIAFCGVYIVKPSKTYALGAYPLSWRCGRKSIIRGSSFYVFDATLDGSGHLQGPMDAARVVVSGNGGGRWYNYNQEGTITQGADFRQLLVTGTSEPLRIYSCDVEHSKTATAQMEVRDCADVAIYGMKCEGNAAALLASNVGSLKVIGYGGNAAALERNALFRIIACDHVILSGGSDTAQLTSPDQGNNKTRGVDPRLWYMVSERTKYGRTCTTRALDRISLYKRG